MKIWRLFLLGCCLGVIGCGSSLDLTSWSSQEAIISQVSLETIGMYLLHGLPPGMEGEFRVTNGLTDQARSFAIEYQETRIATGRDSRSLNPVDPEKVPLLKLPPAYTQTPEAKLIQALNAAGYEYRAIYEGDCYSPAYLTAYEIVVLTPAQAECISLFRSQGYYVSIFDGDSELRALNALIQDVTR